MLAQTSDHRYVDSTVRLNKVTGLGAGLISLLMVATTWGQWRLFAAVLAIQVALMAFNMWANLVLLKRRGVRFTESLRTVVNTVGFIAVAPLTHFSVVVWMWLPYVALTFEHFGRRASILMLGFVCVAADGLAIVSAVPWQYPVAFTVLAFIGLTFSRARFDTIRAMLVESDAHARALELAHAATERANERLRAETRAREAMELELRQAQKVEAIGRLAAGIAHEINTPVQFVGDNVHFLGDAFADVLALVTHYREIHQGALHGDAAEAALRAEADADIDYLAANVPGAIANSAEGLRRIAAIVRSMKEFAHPDRQQATAIDLNRAIETTLELARHEYKLVADISLDLGELPPVTCHPGQVHQVLLNIIVNAAHAVAEAVAGRDQKGRIAIRTRLEGQHAVIGISDSGPGIPDEIRHRIFDPFFTTKEVGRGTGQGLAIAQGLVKAHGGTLSFESTVGQGATFFVRLPIAPPRAMNAAA